MQWESHSEYCGSSTIPTAHKSVFGRHCVKQIITGYFCPVTMNYYSVISGSFRTTG